MADKVLPKTKHDMPWAKHAPNAVIQAGVLRVTCAECGERFSKALTPQEEADVVAMYAGGGVHPAGRVQDVFPNWSGDDRELFLMSHMCDSCWRRRWEVRSNDRDGRDSLAQPEVWE